MKKIFFLVVLILLVAGCEKSEKDINPEIGMSPQSLENYFQVDWAKIDRIDIRNGATGELRTFKEKEILRKWIDETRIIEITPDPSQEGRTGFRFSANLYEGDQLKFGFTDGHVGKVYILSSDLLYNQLKSLYESYTP
ncbi:membrane lipoprotein lipid attachment site-containing protein [Paenibacillus sp. 1P03SA]|uniref:membrane lipoprotein lipid attachment site-containing protein n=1 Tax=Paenibacillus sp. 1P03SA TaxID=3132294 RepID=UPI0039A2B6AC